MIGLGGGVLGGLLSRLLAGIIGPDANPVTRWRQAHPVLFAVGCGAVAALVALVTGGTRGIERKVILRRTCWPLEFRRKVFL